MHKKWLALLVSLGLAFATMMMVATPAHALGKVKCDVLPSGLEDNDGDVALLSGAFDPIVYHNVESQDPSEAQPHQHDFFGSRWVTVTGDINSGTYSQVRTYSGNGSAATTSCRDVRDTAEYWAPALKYISGPKAGQRVKVQQFTAYYRGFAGQTTHAGSEAIPAGARLVAQDMVGYGLSGWTCGQNSTVTGGQNTIPDCTGQDGTPGNTLTAHINFPSCWNGVLPNHPGDPGNSSPNSEYGDTRDNNYGVAGTYTSNDFIYPTNKTACPASHPREVVQLRETIQYEYVGNGSDVALASDGAAAHGSTMHVDFWNTWNQPGFVQFVQDCVKTTAEPNCDL